MDRGGGSAAWLNTGDAELLAPPDLDDWEVTFTGDLPGERVLALPHHGSDRNSGADLQSLCPQAILVAVNSKSSKHPGAAASEAAGDRLSCVTGQPGTEVIMHFWSRQGR